MEGPGLCLQGDYGTYADAGSIGGSPALSPRHALGDLPESRASLGGEISVPRISARPLSGTD